MRDYYFIHVPLLEQDVLYITNPDKVGECFVHHCIKHKVMTKEYAKGLAEIINSNYNKDDAWSGLAVRQQITLENGNGVELSAIVIRDQKRKVIIHEVVHMAYKILDTHGINIDVDNHEMLAYLVEYISEEIWKYQESMEDKKKKAKRRKK